jgi:hypothetical protein
MAEKIKPSWGKHSAKEQDRQTQLQEDRTAYDWSVQYGRNKRGATPGALEADSRARVKRPSIPGDDEENEKRSKMKEWLDWLDSEEE